MRRSPFFPGNATQQDVVDSGPNIIPDAESTGKPRPGFGALANMEATNVPVKATKNTPRIHDELITEFDSGQGYDVLRVREQAARSYGARTLVIPAGNIALLVGDDAERVRLRVTVIGDPATDPSALIGALSDLSAGDGYTLVAGDSLETTVRSAIYVASADTSDPVTVTLWMERDA